MNLTEIPTDLQPVDEAWPDVRVPAGWEPIAHICRDIHARSHEVADEITACIAAEIEPHSDERAVAAEDLRAATLRNLQSAMVTVAERRLPTADELAVRAQLGRRRAAQGLPVDAVLRSYHVGYREIWTEFVRSARVLGPEAADLLPEAASAAWAWVHEVTRAVAVAYGEIDRVRESYLAGLRQQFLEAVLTGDPTAPALAQLTRTLGFDPDATFQAICAPRSALDAATAAQLIAQLRLETGPAVDLFLRGDEVIALTQAVIHDATVATLRRALPTTTLGVGIPRQGIAGARMSIGDARTALAVAEEPGETRTFTDDWFAALVLEHRDELRAVLQPGIAAAADHPHLGSAVTALSDARFSVSRAGRALDLHPNSVTYRLDRWQQLTGWDPRHKDGMLNSLAALALRRAGG